MKPPVTSLVGEEKIGSEQCVASSEKTKGNILTDNDKTNIIRMKKNERGKGTHIFADTKQHYELLDGLRGVAALLVVYYHVHEGFAFASGAPVIEGFNHGYLAVDFFFILSGFVISYAYDDRWNKTLTTANFFRRRLIRLHPMVVMGAVIGLASFLVSGSERWDGTHAATSATMLALLCSSSPHCPEWRATCAETARCSH